MQTPIKNEIWQHHSGRLYKINCVTNEHGDHSAEWPVTVVYRDVDGRTWSRPLAVFLRKFKLVLPCQTKTDQKELKMIIGEPNSIEKILEAAFKQIEKEHDVHLEFVEFETRQLPRGIMDERAKREVVAITWKATSA